MADFLDDLDIFEETVIELASNDARCVTTTTETEAPSSYTVSSSEFKPYNERSHDDQRAANIMMNNPINNIKLTLLEEQNTTDAFKLFMEQFVQYCSTDPQSVIMTSKLLGYAKSVKETKFSVTQLRLLRAESFANRKRALEIKPDRKLIYVHEYNVLDYLLKFGVRDMVFGVNKIVINIDNLKYKLKKTDLLWNMTVDDGEFLCEYMGSQYKWVSRGDGSVHVLFLHSIGSVISVVDGRINSALIQINNSPALNMLKKEIVDKISDFRLYIFEEVVKHFADVKQVPQSNQSNDNLSVMIAHCPPFTKEKLAFLLTEFKYLDKWWPKAPEFLRNSHDFMLSLSAKDGLRHEWYQPMAKRLAQAITGDKAAKYLEQSRALRGSDNSTANTKLKNMVNCGVPYPDLSTNDKWTKVLKSIRLLLDDRIACIGCTGKYDWWSNCHGHPQHLVKMYDLNASPGVEVCDVTSVMSKIAPCDILMSDVYLKDTPAAPGTSDYWKFNGQSKVPGYIWRLAEEAGAKTVIFKCFPQRGTASDKATGAWNLDHLDFARHAGWNFNVHIEGRGHNMELIACFTRIKNTKNVISAKNFIGGESQKQFLDYVFSVAYDCNKFRNLSVITYSRHNSGVPQTDLTRLPKGEIQQIRDEIAKGISEAISFDDIFTESEGAFIPEKIEILPRDEVKSSSATPSSSSSSEKEDKEEIKLSKTAAKKARRKEREAQL